jgi:hypothetical protein
MSRKPLRLKCLACEVLARPVYLCAAHSPHIVDVELFQYGLHRHPPTLRAKLQSHVDSAAENGFDAIVMAYGLCGQATAGLTARHIPLVLPRAHDCITLFLGGRVRYQQQFKENPGTYWYVQDYIERDDGSGAAMSLGSGGETDIDAVYEEYVEKYGQDNADYLMEVMGAWQQHYSRAAYIDMGVGDGAAVEQKAQADAAKRGWLFERVAGDMILIRRLLNGDWDSDFLILEPDQQLAMTYDEEVIGCALVKA